MSLPYFLADDPASGVLTGAEAKHAPTTPSAVRTA